VLSWAVLEYHGFHYQRTIGIFLGKEHFIFNLGIMAHYIQFQSDTQENDPILVEVSKDEISNAPQGLVKAGKSIDDVILSAQSRFSEAIKTSIHQNVQGFMNAINSLPNPPSEVEITFGLKATGEIGNVAVGKVGGEVNYTVKLVWKSTTNSTQ
jgi:hypothetical protein